MSEMEIVGVIELGDVAEETKGVFNPMRLECSVQSVDARDN